MHLSVHIYQDWTLRLKQVIAQVVLLQAATLNENNSFVQDTTGPCRKRSSNC